MSVGYHGIYWFGCVCTGEDGLAEETLEALEAAEVDDIDGWINSLIGWNWLDPACGSHADRNARQVARWGVAVETSWSGLLDYSTTTIYPVDAMVSEWRDGLVPTWTSEQIETWRAGLERLRAELPGLSEPALRYGCRVG